MDCTNEDRLQRVKLLAVWRTWWKWYQLSVQFQGQVPLSECFQWRIDCTADLLSSYLHAFAHYFKQKNIQLLSNEVPKTDGQIVAPLRLTYLYETAWTFLKHYPFHQEAYPILYQFIYELENVENVEAFLLPHFEMFKKLIETEYGINVASALKFNASSGAPNSGPYSMHPGQLFENTERLFFMFNLALLAHKFSLHNLWDQTIHVGNIYVDRAPCIKQEEVAKKLYQIILETVTKPTLSKQSTTVEKRPSFLTPVLIPPPPGSEKAVMSDPELTTQIMNAKKSAEAILVKAKSHSRSSSVSATLMMNLQSNTIGIGMVVEKNAISSISEKKEKKKKEKMLKRKDSKSSPRKSSVEDNQFSRSEGYSERPSNSSNNSNNLRERKQDEKEFKQEYINVTPGKTSKPLPPPLKRKKNKKRLSWFNVDPALIPLSETGFLLEKEDPEETIKSSQSAPELPIILDRELVPENYLDLYTHLSTFLSSYCDYIQLRSSPPPSPPDFLANYIQPKQEDALRLRFNAILSKFLFGPCATVEMQSILSRVEILVIVMETIETMIDSDETSVAISDNAMRLLTKKIVDFNIFKRLSDTLKTEANHVAVFIQFAMNLRKRMTVYENEQLMDDSANNYYLDLLKSANTCIQQLLVIVLQQFMAQEFENSIEVNSFASESKKNGFPSSSSGSEMPDLPQTPNKASPRLVESMTRTTLSPRMRAASSAPVPRTSNTGWQRVVIMDNTLGSQSAPQSVSQLSDLQQIDQIKQQSPGRVAKTIFKMSNPSKAKIHVVDPLTNQPMILEKTGEGFRPVKASASSSEAETDSSPLPLGQADEASESGSSSYGSHVTS